MLDGEHLAAQAIQKAPALHHLFPGHGRLYERFRLLHPAHQGGRSLRLLGAHRTLNQRGGELLKSADRSERVLLCSQGARLLSLALRVHVYGRHANYSLDDDRGAVSDRDQRDRPFDQLLDSQPAPVRRAAELQESAKLPGWYVLEYVRSIWSGVCSKILITKSYECSLLEGSYAVQWFFAGVSLGAVVFVWLLLPETHGKKLSEIEEYFHNNFLAAGAESKAKKERAKRRNQRSGKSSVTEPLNPSKSKAPQNV